MTYRIEFVTSYFDGEEFIERDVEFWQHFHKLGDAESKAIEILDTDRDDECSAIMSIAILDDENDEVVVDSGSYFYKPLRWGNYECEA